MKRLLVATGLAAPSLILVGQIVGAGTIGSQVFGSLPPALVAAGVVAVGGWAAAVAWLNRQRSAATALGTLVSAAEQMADGDLDVSLPDQPSLTGQRLAAALDRVSTTLSATQEAASVDRLTGVTSRTALLAALTGEVERAGRYERQLSVAFVDIDHFKTVNDTYGHAAGDVVLRGVAQAIKDHLRSSDVIGRYGGEEFMLVLPETGVDDAALLGEKLRALVARQRFVVEGNRQLGVTVSVGIAGGFGRNLRVEALAGNADAAMYTAKALGRNQTYVFSEPDEDARVLRAPVSAGARAQATAIGLAARDAAAAVLGAVIASLPGHKGQPSALVASIVTALAERMDLPDTEIERIRLAAMLRDIGKVVVSDEILDKPAGLSPAEWQSVVQHPQLGQVIIERAASLRDALPIVLHHHEHYAGDGYPFGLRGNDIPLGARIVAIADAYDAMTQDRPYRPGLSHEEAIRELRRNAGTQFDPDLVTVFCSLYAESPPEPDPGIEELLRPLNLVPPPGAPPPARPRRVPRGLATPSWEREPLRSHGDAAGTSSATSLPARLAPWTDPRARDLIDRSGERAVLRPDLVGGQTAL